VGIDLEIYKKQLALQSATAQRLYSCTTDYCHCCIPVPQIIATAEPSSRVKGELLKDSDWSDDLAFEIGVTLARLHNNRTDGYGDVTKPKTLVREPNLYTFNRKFLDSFFC